MAMTTRAALRTERSSQRKDKSAPGQRSGWDSMKVIVYMAMTANGLIATERDDVWFVSKVSWKSFNRMSRRAGNLVMGRRTLDVSIKGTEPYASDGSFPYPGRLNVIVSRRRIRNRWGKDVVFVRSPRAALAELRNNIRVSTPLAYKFIGIASK